MDPLIGGALISGGASLLGGLFGNSASARQAALDRRFQARMSRTAVQRRVEDLKAAGLNPMLAYMPGSAAGTGAASTPSGSTARQSDPVTPAVGAAIQTMAMRQQGLLNTSTAARNNAEARSLNAQAAVTEAVGTGKAVAEIEQLEANTRLLAMQFGEAAERIVGLKTENAQKEEMLELQRSLVTAQEAALRAGIPVKDFLASLARVGTEVITSLQTPKARELAGSLIRDTVNHGEDIVRNGAKKAFEPAEKAYRWLDRWWSSVKATW